jgi:RND family efflux transporter MFP subunit
MLYSFWQSKPRRWLFGSCLLLALIFILSFDTEVEIQALVVPPLALVSVIDVSPQAQELTVATMGVTSSRWPTEVIATVEGRVVSISPGLEVGKKISKGTLLAQLNAVNYQAELDRIKSQLSAAKLNVARVKYEQDVALKMGGGRLKTAFARHELQMESARMELHAIESALLLAQQRVSDTSITAPFDAVILQQSLTLNEWVSRGSSLFQLASSVELDVTVGLSERQWQLVNELEEDWQVKVIARDGSQWLAALRYMAPSQNPNTRQRGLVLKVEFGQVNETPLLSGQQVSVEFSGQLTTSVFSIPSSSLTHDSKVWTVGDDNLLMHESIELLQRGDSRSLVRFYQNPLLSRKVVLYPLRSMLSGLKVDVRSPVVNAAPL